MHPWNADARQRLCERSCQAVTSWPQHYVLPVCHVMIHNSQQKGSLPRYIPQRERGNLPGEGFYITDRWQSRSRNCPISDRFCYTALGGSQTASAVRRAWFAWKYTFEDLLGSDSAVCQNSWRAGQRFTRARQIRIIRVSSELHSR